MLAALNSWALMMFNRGDLRERFFDGDWSGCWPAMRSSRPGAIIGFLFMLAILAGIVVLVISLVHYSRKHHDYSQYKTGSAAPTASSDQPVTPQEENTALRILDERYARGEIDEEAYLKHKENLRRS